VLKVGGTVVNINPLYAEEEVLRQLKDSETRVVVTLDMRSLHPKLAAIMDDAALEKVIVCRMADALPFPQKTLFPLLKRKEIASIPVDGRHVSFRTLTANDGAFRPDHDRSAYDVALLQYTGGTTARPRRNATHANLYANTMQTGDVVRPDRGRQGTILGVLPLFHVFDDRRHECRHLRKARSSFCCPVSAWTLPRQFTRSGQRCCRASRPCLPRSSAAKQLGKYDLSSLKFCLSAKARRYFCA
jgi:long-chain acyl-CoA synthetase